MCKYLHVFLSKSAIIYTLLRQNVYFVTHFKAFPCYYLHVLLMLLCISSEYIREYQMMRSLPLIRADAICAYYLKSFS